ncbi:hypothetical protein Q1695_001902 [Nippostrongylus brasiliensis]|nr:hypothetical protein Q1695_001902 [Nippostrongylus brasiliensis]
MSALRVLVTGAAGQIGYSLVLQIASGDVFGRDTPITLVLLDLPQMATSLEGVQFELQDCAFPSLAGIEIVTTERDAFRDIDYAFLVGAMPRKAGMERRDLLSANVKIFKSQGKALAEYAKPSTRVLVVGNPANTNAFICAKYAAPRIPQRNFTAMSRLDHNRTIAQIALKVGVPYKDVKNVIVWGNHSSTMFPDVRFAKISRGGSLGEVCMSVPSDGSYGVPPGLVFSFPVTIDLARPESTKLCNLPFDEFSNFKFNITLKELIEERDEALKCSSTIDAYTAVNDIEYLHGPLVSTVQKRGAVIIQKRKLSSALSAAKAACDHMHDWYFGTRPGEWVCMSVPSDGSYGVPPGLVFSFPVTIDPSTGEYEIVHDLPFDEFSKSKFNITLKELIEERDEALKCCEGS